MLVDLSSDVFTAHISHLHTMLAWIRERLQGMAFDSADLLGIELSCEEALVNIIRHGYKDQEGLIHIQVVTEKDLLKIRISDEGPPFNPLQEKIIIEVEGSLESRREGGLGIFLMQQCMDHLEYQREGDRNVLTLMKKKKRA